MTTDAWHTTNTAMIERELDIQIPADYSDFLENKEYMVGENFTPSVVIQATKEFRQLYPNLPHSYIVVSRFTPKDQVVLDTETDQVFCVTDGGQIPLSSSFKDWNCPKIPREIWEQMDELERGGGPGHLNPEDIPDTWKYIPSASETIGHQQLELGKKVLSWTVIVVILAALTIIVTLFVWYFPKKPETADNARAGQNQSIKQHVPSPTPKDVSPAPVPEQK